MKHSWILLFLLSTALAADPEGVIIQPDIPGISIREAGGGIEIVNDSDFKIVGLSLFVNSNSPYHMVNDGLDSWFPGIEAHATMPAGAGRFGDIAMPNAPSGTYSLDWVLFENGEFYGTEKDAGKLAVKARVRQQFFGSLYSRGRLDRESYADEVTACVNDHRCGKHGATAEERTILHRAADLYRRQQQRYGARVDQFLRDFTARHMNYPKVRRVANAHAKQLEPKDKIDGWSLDRFAASCKNSSGYYTANAGIACGYSIFDPGNPNRQTGDPATQTGFSSSSVSTCYNAITNKFGTPLRSSFEHGTLTLRSPGGSLALEPPHMVQTKIETNRNQQLFEGWIGDTTYFSVAYGYNEPVGPAGSLQDTYCTLFFDSPNTGEYPNNTLLGHPGLPPFYSSILLIYSNTTQQAFANNYGYFIANYDEARTCGDPAAFVTAYEIQPAIPGSIWAPPMPAVKNSAVAIGCLKVQKVAENSGPSCDITTDWCCCLATTGNYTQCLGYGLSPQDYCSLDTPALKTYGTTTGMMSTTSAFATGAKGPHDNLGVGRSGGAWLLDTVNEKAYIAGETTFMNGFIPTGGVQSTDVPVSGDWTGEGRAKIGYYRPSTGEWFLDANGDGVFDSGDYQFVFGGSSGDKPVVGDWAALGRDCVGVFSAGYFWTLDSNCNQHWDFSDAGFAFGGVAGDVPVVGKWLGPSTKVGVVRPYTINNVPQGPPYFWVLDGAPPLAAQAAHLPGFTFAFGGVAGDKFVAGDWWGTGRATAGVYRSGTWLLDDGTHAYNYIYQFGGVAGDVPVVGKW